MYEVIRMNMKKYENICKGHTLIKALGVTALALILLVGIAVAGVGTPPQPSTCTWTPISATINYGTPLSADQLNAVGSTPGTISYVNLADNSPVKLGDILNTGTYSLQANLKPTSSAYLPSHSKAVTLTVNKVNPTISCDAPTITYGDVLGDPTNPTAKFNGNDVAGTFSWGNVPDPLNAGSYVISLKFTPSVDSSVNFNPVSKDDIVLTVNKADPGSLIWDSKAISYGTPLTSDQLDAHFTPSIAGDYKYTLSDQTIVVTQDSNTILQGGIQTLYVFFTNPNYISKSISTTINVLPVAGIGSITVTGPANTGENYPVTLKDASLGGPISTWSWTITGNGINKNGNIVPVTVTSSAANPSIGIFKSSGSYTAKLSVSNAAGSCITQAEKTFTVP